MSEHTDYTPNDVSADSPPIPRSSSAMDSHETVVKVPRSEGLRNELSLRLRDTNVSVRGWKACAVETVGVALMVAGGFFLAMHGGDIARSVGSAVSNTIKR